VAARRPKARAHHENIAYLADVDRLGRHVCQQAQRTAFQHHASQGNEMNSHLSSAPHNRTQRLFRLLCGSLLLIAVAVMPRAAWADCWLTGGGAPTVNFNAGTINLTIAAQPSTTTPIWQSQVITPPGNTSISCNNNTNSGIAQSTAGPPTGGDNTLFPTNIPGISYRLLHIADAAQYTMPSYPNYTLTARTDSPLSGTTQMFLYYTGPYLPPNGGTMNGPLAQWNADVCSDPDLSRRGNYRGCNGAVTAQAIEYFNISATITVYVPTCNVDPSSVNKVVTLPNVTTAQLAASQTPGSTSFSLKLVSCPVGQKIFINLDTANPQTGVTGVIAPTTGGGYATNVGVQILKADGTTPITFTSDPNQAIYAGAASASNYAINLYARYYRTSTPVSPGNVRGIATYTLNYQ
jgi:type 1 fimbria pilin